MSSKLFMKGSMFRGLLCMLLLFFTTVELHAQKKKTGMNRKARYQEKFLNKQFWVGFKAGGNTSKANPLQRYSAFTNSDGSDPESYDKEYIKSSKLGAQAGLVVTFYYRRFSASFQPGYRRMVFTYTNQYSWTDPNNANNTLEQEYEAVQKLDYFEFPLLFRYEPLKTRLKPFAQGGFYYGLLNNAYKQTTITVTDGASGGQDPYVSEQITVEAKDLFINSLIGWTIGAGVSYPLGNARISAEFMYMNNTNNITNVANRYSNDRLTGSGDILDDVNLRNVSISFSVVIPLRFVILKENYKTE